MITQSQINAFLKKEPPATVEMNPVLSFIKPINVQDRMSGVWTTDRIAQAEKDLYASIGMNDLITPNEVDQQQRLEAWWRDKGQFIPRHVLDQLGITGGAKVPTLEESIQLGQKEQINAVKDYLGLERPQEQDPLDALVPIDMKVTDPTDITQKKPIKPELAKMLKASSVEDLNIIRTTIASNPLDFDEGLYKAVEDEIKIREVLPEIYRKIGDKPLMILLGTDFFNTLAFNLPEYTSRKGLSPIESLFDLPKGTQSQYVRAVARVREHIAAQDPRTLTQIGLETGNLSATLIKFAAMPDPSKARVFASLSPAVKAAIGVGTKAGMTELLQAPRPGETLEERFEAVAVTTGVGALTGATLAKAWEAVKTIPIKLKAAKAHELFPHISQKDWAHIIDVVQSGEPYSLRISKPPPVAPAGFRTGMAEIEPIKKVLGKVAKVAPKTKEAIVVQAAKKALEVRRLATKVAPVKILTKQEAVSLQKSNLVTGEADKIRIVPSAKIQRAIQVKENEIAKLKTRRNELMAEKQFAVAKTKAAEIRKKEEALEKIKERAGIKLEQTIEGAKAKIEKIRKAQEFRDELRNDAVSMITAIPKELRTKFINRANKVRTLKGLQKLTNEVEVGIDKLDRKLAVGDLRETIRDLEKKNRRGKVRFGKIPSPQRERIIEIVDEISTKRISTQLEPTPEVKPTPEIQPWEMTKVEYEAKYPVLKKGYSSIGEGKKIDAIPDEEYIWVFHATDENTAKQFVEKGIKQTDKPSNLARARMELGEEGVEYAPGRGLAPGLTVGIDPRDLSGYGRQDIAIRVKKGQIRISPEQADLGVKSVGVALAANDAYIEGDILPENVMLIGEKGKIAKHPYDELKQAASTQPTPEKQRPVVRYKGKIYGEPEDTAHFMAAQRLPKEVNLKDIGKASEIELGWLNEKGEFVGEHPEQVQPTPEGEVRYTFDQLDVKARRGREQLLGADLKSLQQVTQRLSSELAGGLEGLDEEVAESLRLPNERVRQLNLLTQKNVDEIDVDDIRLVTQSLQQLAHNAKLKSRLLRKEGYEPIDGALKTITQDEISTTKLAERKAGKIEAGKAVPTKKGRLRKTADFGKRVLKYDDAHLDTLVQLSTKSDATKLKQILDTDLHEGHRKSSAKLTEWIDASTERFEKIGFNDINQLREEVEVTLGGRKIKLEKDFLIKLELHSRNPENLKAILTTKGWQIGSEKITYPKDAEGNDLVDRLGEIREALKVVRDDPVLLSIADWDNEIVMARAAAIDETSKILNGYELARDPLYTSRPRILPKKVEGAKDVSVPPEQIGRYLPLTGGTWPMKLDRWSDDFLEGLESDANFYGMAIPLRNARVIVSNEIFQDAMKEAGREIELQNIITILRRVQGVSTSRSTLEVFGGKIQRGFTSAALGFRVSTIGTQAMSYPAAFAEIDSMMRPMRPVGKETFARIEEDSPLMELRWKGRRVNVEVGTSAAAEPFETLFFQKSHKLSNKALRGLITGDKFAIGNIYKQGVVPELLSVKRNGNNVDPFTWEGGNVADLPAMNDPDSKAFRYAAARRLEYVVRRSQPMYDMLDRSVSLSNPNILERSFFIFRTALEAQENIGMRAVDTYSKSTKTLTDKKELTKDLGAVALSAFSVAAWKKGLKWAIGTGATAILAAFGIYKFDDRKHRESLPAEIAKDTAKNIVKLNKVGKLAVEIGERVADTIVGDGYNWNRNSFDNPILDTLQTGTDATVAFVWAISDAGLLDEFVEEVTDEDKAFNEQLAKRIAGNLERVVRTSFEFGTRIAGQPFLAPYQEFVKPFTTDSKIKIIREVTYSDVESPQKFSKRVFELFEKRKELNDKSKVKRLTREEERKLEALNSFASRANNLAEIVKEMENPELRKMRFQAFEISILLTEDRIK